MEKITFCIPSKTNLRYLKTAIPSIRKNAYRKDHDIIVFVDSDEDGTLEWLEENSESLGVKYYVNPDLGNSLYGIGRAYDYCIEKSETDIIMIFHADMILGKDADCHALKHLKPQSVVCSTRIEPPLHPNGGEKILEDFGMYPEEFKADEFTTYVERLIVDNKDKTTDGIFAPWMIYKEDIQSIGGHDPIMHSCREDSDLFNRFVMNGYQLIQSWDSLVYHFTGRGAGSFDGDTKRHEKWKRDMNNSTKEFIRKWGSGVKHDTMMKPIIPPKYNIGIRVNNCNSELLEALEPWCDNILIDDEMQVITTHYLDVEQKNTKFDLSKRILTTPFQQLENDIIIIVDRNTFTQQDFAIIQNISEIIQDSGEIGEFELGNLKVKINKMEEYQNNLIKL